MSQRDTQCRHYDGLVLVVRIALFNANSTHRILLRNWQNGIARSMNLWTESRNSSNAKPKIVRIAGNVLPRCKRLVVVSMGHVDVVCGRATSLLLGREDKS